MNCVNSQVFLVLVDVVKSEDVRMLDQLHDGNLSLNLVTINGVTKLMSGNLTPTHPLVTLITLNHTSS